MIWGQKSQAKGLAGEKIARLKMSRGKNKAYRKKCTRENIAQKIAGKKRTGPHIMLAIYIRDTANDSRNWKQQGNCQKKLEPSESIG